MNHVLLKYRPTTLFSLIQEVRYELNEIKIRNYIGDMLWMRMVSLAKGNAFAKSVTSTYIELVEPSSVDNRSAQQIVEDTLKSLKGSD